jgi:acyl-CoA dehydrogenase
MTAMTDEMNIGAVLAEQLQRLLSRAMDSQRLAALEAGAAVAGPLITGLWAELEQLGAPLALAGGEVGAGLSWLDCLPMLRTFGWHGAPAPLAETLLAAQVLTAAGLSIPAGPIAISGAGFVLDDSGLIHGRDALVPWLPQCQSLLGLARRRTDAAAQVFILPTAALALRPVDSLARIPSAAVDLGAGVRAAAMAPAPTGTLLPESLALLKATQISGILDRILALTIDYANTRSQFGRTIGKFQAIQHHVAEIAMQAAAAQAAVIFGCQQMDAGRGASGGAIAKLRCSVAASAAASAAHQVFGAIGVTEEHELQLLTRRLWQWRGEAGSDHFWAEKLGREVMASGGQQLWPRITASA